MALYYETGNGWVQTTLAKKELGLDAILCCPGPSLKNVDASKLKGRGRMVFAINTAYPTVKPDVWMGLDTIECYDRNILYEPFMKIFRGTYYDNMFYEKVPVKNFPNVFWGSFKVPEAGKTMLDYRGHKDPFVWHKNALAAMLHVMIWMGAKTIYLAGCDMGGNQDYCHDGKLSEEQHKINRKLYKEQVYFINDLSLRAKAHGVTIKSVTPKSPLNKFLKYIPIEEAIKISENKIIKPKDNNYYHAIDAEKVYKQAYENKQYKITNDRFDHATKYIKNWEQGSLLDIGCGRGEILDFAEEKGFSAKGVEIVEELIDNKRVVRGVSHELPFKDDEFDYVTCLDVIEHIQPDDSTATLKEIKRVAKKLADARFDVIMMPRPQLKDSFLDRRGGCKRTLRLYRWQHCCSGLGKTPCLFRKLLKI